MTYIVPNYFSENNYDNLIEIDNILCLKYLVKYKDNAIYARTTMHSMVILLEGSKVVHLNDEDIPVNSEEICFMTQNNYYLSERITENARYKSLIVYFDDSFIFDLIKKYHLKSITRNPSNIIKVNYKKDSFLENTVVMFQQYLDSEVDTSLLKLKIEEIFLHAMRIDASTFYGFINAVLSTSQDRIRFILESNIDLLQTVDDMCRITRTSQNSLRRYIKKTYDTTPKIWLDNKRLEKATLMLKNTEKSISEIATDCGYATASWFIAQFKKQYNQTPKDFRHNK